METDPFSYFRSREAFVRAGAAVLDGNLDALKVAATWITIPVDWTLPQGQAPQKERELWLWVWEGCSIHPDLPETLEDLLDASGGMPLADARLSLRLLIRNRLIYPDGTVSGICSDILNQAVNMLRMPVTAKALSMRLDK